MPLFQNLDLLFGFISLMLASGTVVAAGTQLVTSVTRMRSRHLRRALEELLGQLDPRHLSPRDSRELALLLLRHPWLCGQTDACACELRREHFVRLLMELACGSSHLAACLRQSFGFAGVEEARALAHSIGAEALRLERECPGEPACERDTRAVIVALGPHPLLALIHAWYGPAMLRATRRYRLGARIVTSVLALVLVAAARIDVLQFLGLRISGHWPGMALSWVLISLGTPFWYDRLKDLLHFRPSAH
jgi:hypothetical protein